MLPGLEWIDKALGGDYIPSWLPGGLMLELRDVLQMVLALELAAAVLGGLIAIAQIRSRHTKRQPREELEQARVAPLQDKKSAL